MDFFDDVEGFFGICPRKVQHVPLSKKRATATAFETLEDLKENSDHDQIGRLERKAINSDDVLKLDWSLKCEMAISSPVMIPMPFKSSDFSFENQCSLSLSCFPGKKDIESSWFSSSGFYSLFPYYKYPINASLKNISDYSCTSINETGSSWIDIFRHVFFQFENGQLDYFYLLHASFTLLFIFSSGKYELRARIKDRRISSSLVEQGIIVIDDVEEASSSKSLMSDATEKIASDVLDDLAELETLSPGSTYIILTKNSRLHQSGRLFSMQKTQQYNRIMAGAKPILFTSIESIRNLIFYKQDTSRPLSLFLKVVNPILISPKPFIGGTIFIPRSTIERPIKTILRDPETGDVVERSTYKVVISGLLLPHTVGSIISNLMSYFETANSDFSVVLSTDPSTLSLNLGENEPNPQTFLHRIDFDATKKKAKYDYLDCNSIL